MESLHPRKLTWQWLEKQPWMKMYLPLKVMFQLVTLVSGRLPVFSYAKKMPMFEAVEVRQVFGMVVQATDLPNREMIGLSDPLPGCVVNFEPGSHKKTPSENQRIHGKMEGRPWKK